MLTAVSTLTAACSSTTGNAGSAGLGGSAATSGSVSPGRVSAGKPNVLFVLTDDMRFDDLQHLPNVRKLVGEQGMTFDDEFDNVTLCCPARTSILRGQYSHNTGVLTNGGNNGGFETAHASKVEDATIATAMHSAGYSTGLFGKYLNGYPNTASPSYVPPGWDTWSSSTKGNAYGEYNYTLNENGKQVDYGHKPDDYGTEVYARQANDFMHQAEKDRKPFFAYLAVYAPHQPATPAPQDVDAFPGLKAPRDPAYDEADVSDKPQYIQQLEPLTKKQQNQIDVLARKRAQSLQAVDRAAAALIDQLTKDGQLENTYVIFTSDNGFHLGQHRMPAGKQTAYETDVHLPLLVRGPGVKAGSHTTAITGNIDLAPTIAAIGGATMTDKVDGRSLMPFLDGSASGNPTDWRQAYLLEHWTATSEVDRSGSGQLEPDDLDQGGAPADEDTAPPPSPTTAPTTAPAAPTTTARATTGNPRAGKASGSAIPEFRAIRVAGWTYVEYTTGEKELYDLSTDPDELNNVAASANKALVDQLHQRLEQLRTCAGDSCRSAESAPLDLRH